MPFIAINPVTGTEIGRRADFPAGAVRQAVRIADRAYRSWSKTTFTERATRLRALAHLLRTETDRHALTMATEMGKPLGEGRAEAEKCAWACEYYAERGADFLAPESIKTDAFKSYVTYRPLGIVLAIMPWNFPYWQVIRFAAPAIMAGNVVLLKHAPNVPGCAEAIADLFHRAGFPDGVFQNLFVTERQVAALIRNPLVRAVTVTGSVRAGRAVARQAGAHIKKTVLELGGSDPYVILEDADLPTAVQACVTSRLINAGQSCIAAKRFVVVEAVRQDFEALVVGEMQRAVRGDPCDPDTRIGPLARADLRETLHRQVAASIRRGARCLLGGEVPAGPGWFYPPTVLTDVSKGMPAFDEELFGPVAVIVPVPTRVKALEAANDTAYGLGAAVFTDDLATGEVIAAETLEAGSCFVNTFVRSDPRLPFGGIRESGYGRELGCEGIREFVNVKTVYVHR